MDPFVETVQLRPALQAAATRGAAFLNTVLSETFLQRLQATIAAMPLQPMPSEEGVARQEGEIFMLRTGDVWGEYMPILTLCKELADLIRTAGYDIEGCAEWQPNEVSVQRYPAGALGITPHLDQKRYHYLVAVFTAEGSAPFTWCADRTGTPIEVWPASAGSLVLLRAPGLAGVEDGRPLHMVAGPEAGQRVSVSFRMDTRSGRRWLQ